MSQAEQEQKLQDAMTSLRALIAPGPVIEQVYQVCDALAARLDAEVGVRSSEGDKLRSLVELYEQYDENSIEYADQIVGLVKDRMKAELGDEAIKGFLQDLRPSEYPTEITGELRLRAEEVIRQILWERDEARIKNNDLEVMHSDLSRDNVKAWAEFREVRDERDEAREQLKDHKRSARTEIEKLDTLSRRLEARVKELEGERDEAMKSVRAFATWQCPFPDGEKGLTNDEHGNQYCAMEARVKELEWELSRTKKTLETVCHPIQPTCDEKP